MASLKNYVVRHKPSYSSTWVDIGYFHTLEDALAAFHKRHEARRDERVWVVELDTDRTFADSHPPRR